METGIRDINGVEICVGDKIRKIENCDDLTVWEVDFKIINVILNYSNCKIKTFILKDKETGYEEVMRYEVNWQYSKSTINKYEIYNE